MENNNNNNVPLSTLWNAQDKQVGVVDKQTRLKLIYSFLLILVVVWCSTSRLEVFIN